MWEVEYTDEFGAWWGALSEREQESIVAAVEVLEERGPGLGRPFVDAIASSRHANTLYDIHLNVIAEEGAL